MKGKEANEPFDCTNMFGDSSECEFACISSESLGIGFTCAFKNPQIMVVTLGQDPTVTFGQSIKFKDSTDIKSSNGKSDLVAGRLIMVTEGEGREQQIAKIEPPVYSAKRRSTKQYPLTRSEERALNRVA